MAVVGLRLKHELEGKPTLDLETPKSKKMIATTRSFEKPMTKLEDISERIATFTTSCSEKLRRQNSHCNMIMVFLHTLYYLDTTALFYVYQSQTSQLVSNLTLALA